MNSYEKKINKINECKKNLCFSKNHISTFFYKNYLKLLVWNFQKFMTLKKIKNIGV